MGRVHNDDGPTATVSLTCFDCRHERSKSYAYQSDSGHIVSCAHPSLPEPRCIGDTTWTTPAWCPVLKRAQEEPGNEC